MKYLVLLFYCGILSTAWGQDIQFSQYYNNPLYSNPAFAGTGENTRVGMNYRSQWVNIDRPYTTYGIWGDHFIVPAKSGVGLSLFRDGQGDTRVRSTEVMAAYSYVVSLGNNWIFRPGLNVGFGMRDIDYYKGVFGDQIDNSGNITSGSSDPILQYQKTKWYPDLGGGALFYNESFWAGISFAHLNTPNQSLAPGVNSELPMKTTIQAGYTHSFVNSRYNPNAKENSITPTFIYKQQGNFHQLDIGVYYTYDPIMFGLWYRGIPGASNTKGLPFSDALIPMIGYNWNGWSFTYSYDFTISKLTNRSSAGSHEISLIYEFKVPYKKGNNIQKSIPCPKFHRRYQ
ncbi:MAG: type IX secretion system membrane protein PorP/SprF [Cytophagaceae bacterium]